jgi:hypothetical protein
MPKKKKASRPARSAARKPARKPTKSAARKPATKAAKRTPQGPSPVNSGRGASPREIGQAVVQNFNEGGADKEVWDRFWHPKAESVEGEGMAMMWRGRKAIQGKSDWWTSTHKVHSASAEGPYVGATGFSIKFRMDTEEKETGKRTQMEEVGVYTIQNGKVIREEFMYGPSRVISEGRRPAAGITESREAEESELREPLVVGA